MPEIEIFVINYSRI